MRGMGHTAMSSGNASRFCRTLAFYLQGLGGQGNCGVRPRSGPVCRPRRPGKDLRLSGILVGAGLNGMTTNLL